MGCIEKMEKTRLWIHKYPGQIQCYLFFKEKEKGFVFFRDKSNGKVKPFNVQLDLNYVDKMFEKCKSVNKHIEDGTLPDKIEDRQICAMCSYKLICLPDITFGEPLTINQDPMFEKRVTEMMELDEARKEYDKIAKVVKEECKASGKATGEINLMVGKYHITGKTDSAGKFKTKFEEV